MRLMGFFLLVVLLISAVCSLVVFFHYEVKDAASAAEFFFGVSFGGNTTREARLLIDKVKRYTNLFVINSWDLSTNETALNDICDYAANARMKVIVYIDYVSYVTNPWYLKWIDYAKERLGSKFLGIYLYDEPGGRQIDWTQKTEGTPWAALFVNVSDYSDASKRYITGISTSRIMQDVKNRNTSVYL